VDYISTPEVSQSSIRRESSSVGPRRHGSQGGRSDGGPFPGGYAGGTPGSRAVDNYWSTNPNDPSFGSGGYGADTVAGVGAVGSRSPPRTNYPDLSNRAAPRTPAPVHQSSLESTSHNYNDPYGRTKSTEPLNFSKVNSKPTGFDQYGNSAPARQNTDPFDPFGANTNYAAAPGEIYGPRRQDSKPTVSSYYSSNQSTALGSIPEPRRIPDRSISPGEVALERLYNNSRSPPPPPLPSQSPQLLQQQPRHQTEYYDPYAQGEEHLHTYPTPTTLESTSPLSVPHGIQRSETSHVTMRSPVDGDVSPQGLPYEEHHEETLPEYNALDPSQNLQLMSSGSGSGGGGDVGGGLSSSHGYGYPREKQ